MSTTISLLIEVRNERPTYEEVHVQDLGHSRYRLLQSPGFVQGLAAGDIFQLEQAGTYELLEREGNVCIQIFSEQTLELTEPIVSAEFAPIGGRRDGQLLNVLVYTVPVAIGFPAIERVLGDIKNRFPGLDWYYGNIYDSSDGVTPLNWWLKP
jgi:hypothetical protein